MSDLGWIAATTAFTVFVPVDVYDELEFDLEACPPRDGSPGERPFLPEVAGPDSRGLRVFCSAVEGEANLATRALRALEVHTGWAFKGRVRVHKHIPVGAGLGGGSANAAVSLLVGTRILAEAGAPPIGPAKLRALARGLGADVPFFLDPHPSIGQGVGEILEPLSLPSLHLVLVYLDHHLSTARAYESFDDLGPSETLVAFSIRAADAKAGWLALSNSFSRGELGEAGAAPAVAALLENDLEKASFGLFPPLVDAKRALTEAGALAALMSGSGSTVFGLCGDRSAADEVCRRVRHRGLDARVVLGGMLP